MVPPGRLELPRPQGQQILSPPGPLFWVLPEGGICWDIQGFSGIFRLYLAWKCCWNILPFSMHDSPGSHQKIPRFAEPPALRLLVYPIGLFGRLFQLTKIFGVH
mgnify:CR=1 FL=1